MRAARAALDDPRAQQNRPAPAYALFLSLLVLVTPVLVLGLGLFVATFDFPNLVSIILGAVLLAGGFALLPRPARVQATIHRREELSVFFATVDEVGQAQGAPPITGFVFDGEFNAYATEVRVNRRKERLLGIGLLLWDSSTSTKNARSSATNSRIW